MANGRGAAAPFVIRRLRVLRFGPFDDFALSLAPGLNVIVGRNGSGKTQLVGAALFGLLGRPGSGVQLEPAAEQSTDVILEIREGDVAVEVRASAMPANGQIRATRFVTCSVPSVRRHFDHLTIDSVPKMILGDGDDLPKDERLLQGAARLLASMAEGGPWQHMPSNWTRVSKMYLSAGMRKLLQLATIVLCSEEQEIGMPLFLDSQLGMIGSDARSLATSLLNRLARSRQVICLDAQAPVSAIAGASVMYLPTERQRTVRSAASFGYTLKLAGHTGRRRRRVAYYSVFISYGSPNEGEATALNNQLKARGVKTFLFKEHAPPGKKLHRLMSDGVNQYDRVLLVCSRSSLERSGVLNEIEQTLARESREGGGERLIPIALDDYVLDGWHPAREDLARAVRDRVIADFKGAFSDHEKLSWAVNRLLAALRK